MLETEPFHAEFFMQPDKKVSITFYDESMKPVAPEEQIVIRSTNAYRTLLPISISRWIKWRKQHCVIST